MVHLIHDHEHSRPIHRNRKTLYDKEVRTIARTLLYGKNVMIWVALESLEEDVNMILCSVLINC